MEQQLTVSDSTALDVQREQPQSLIEVIARAASDPRCNIEKMQALLDMQERIQVRTAEVEFKAAKARLVERLPRIEKDGIIRNKDGTIRSKYAKFEDIDAVTRPILAEEGFSFSFDTQDVPPKQLKIIATLSHRLGHSDTSHVTLPIDNPVITGMQAVGAVISFGKRYLVTNMLNIITVDEDTDGQIKAVITDDQAATIETLLQDTHSNVPKFLEFWGVAKVEDILASDYKKVIAMLQAKARR